MDEHGSTSKLRGGRFRPKPLKEKSKELGERKAWDDAKGTTVGLGRSHQGGPSTRDPLLSHLPTVSS